MSTKVSLIVCLTLGAICSQAVAQGTFDYSKEQIQSEWKRGRMGSGVFREGLSFEVIHANGKKCKVHLNQDSLIAQADDVLFVNSPKQAFAVHKKQNGYGLIGMVENKNEEDKTKLMEFVKGVQKLQGSLGVEFSQLFPFEIPAPFCFLSTAFVPGRDWIFRSPFVEIESIVKEKDGLITLTYLENSVKKYGDRGSWRRTHLKLDPQKGWNVIGSDWVSLNPNLVASGTETCDFAEIPGNPGAWAVVSCSTHSSVQGNGGGERRQSFSFTNFKQEKMDKNKVKLAYYGIPNPKESYWNNFGWLTSTTIPPVGKK